MHNTSCIKVVSVACMLMAMSSWVLPQESDFRVVEVGSYFIPVSVGSPQAASQSPLAKRSKLTPLKPAALSKKDLFIAALKRFKDAHARDLEKFQKKQEYYTTQFLPKINKAETVVSAGGKLNFLNDSSQQILRLLESLATLLNTNDFELKKVEEAPSVMTEQYFIELTGILKRGADSFVTLMASLSDHEEEIEEVLISLEKPFDEQNS